jgi:DNA-binding NtrC family response regulator
MMRVLLVDDNDNDVELVRQHLAAHFKQVPLARAVSNGTGMSLALTEPEPWDVIICDYALPGFEWPQALNLARRMRPDTPFICISGVIDDDRGLSAIQEGADDYLPKDELKRIGEVVERALRGRQSMADQRRAVDGLMEKLSDAGKAS